MNKDRLFPLRRLHGKIYEWKLDKKVRFSILMNIIKHKVIIVGTPEHGNLGDNAIVLAMYSFLDFAGIPSHKIYEITYSEYELIQDDLKKIIKRKKLVIGIGGGNFGDLWFNEQELRESFVLHFKHCPIIIFPQTVYYSDYSNANSAIELFKETKRITLCAREEESYKIMNRLFGEYCRNIIAVPDIVLFMDKMYFHIDMEYQREGIMFCMRKDKEKAVEDSFITDLERTLEGMGLTYRHSDTVIVNRTNRDNRMAYVREKLKEFMSSELVITDRLHGMVFAAITGTPCLVFGNNHHKVSGTYTWISHLPYIKFVQDDVPTGDEIRELLHLGTQEYNKKPLMPYFDKLKEMVNEELKASQSFWL